MFDGLTLKQKIITIVIISIISISIFVYIYTKNQNYNYIDDTEILTKDNDNNKNLIEDEVSKNDPKEIIIIHMSGEVKKPGIVRLEEGQRMEDAINAAGGLTEDADLSKVNLAFVLEDGIKVNIPNKNENKEEYITKDIGESIIENDNKSERKENKSMININKATQTELETLQGIGPSLATRIIEYREQNGKFNTIEDVKNVSGIGDTKFENIKNSITVK